MNVHEDKITRNMFMSKLKSSTIIDRTSTWFLAGTGATAALIITNIKDILYVLHKGTIGSVLFILIAAMIFAFLQKFLAIRIAIFIAVTELNENIITEPLPEGETLDFENVLPHIIETVPWYQKKYVAKKFINTAKDQYYGYKNSSRMHDRQIVYAYLQLFATVLALAIATINIIII